MNIDQDLIEEALVRKNLIKTSTVVFIVLCICSVLAAQDRINESRTENDALIDIINSAAGSTKFSGLLSQESFEENTFPPSGWKKITNFGGVGWARGKVGMDVPGFSPGLVFDAPPNGGQFVAFASWSTGDADGSLTTGQRTDQWLITPQIANITDGDTLKFFLRYFLESTDSLGILISTTGDSVKAFNTYVTTLAFNNASSNAWIKHRYALTNYVTPGSNIYIAFREHVSNTAIEGDAFFLDLVEVSSKATEVNQRPSGVSHFQLHQNYPNPFNPETTIRYEMPFQGQATLAIYDLIGRQVVLLDAGFKQSGEHVARWDGRENLGNPVPSGIYFCRLDASSQEGKIMSLARKMMLLR
jgi:hypothetical protein